MPRNVLGPGAGATLRQTDQPDCIQTHLPASRLFGVNPIREKMAESGQDNVNLYTQRWTAPLAKVEAQQSHW